MKKKQTNKNYKFTDKRHSIEGIISTSLSCIALILFCLGIIISFHNDGKGGIFIGLLGFFAFVISIAGFITGMHSFKNKEVFYLFSYIGVVINTIIWFVMICILMVGI